MTNRMSVDVADLLRINWFNGVTLASEALGVSLDALPPKELDAIGQQVLYDVALGFVSGFDMFAVHLMANSDSNLAPSLSPIVEYHDQWVDMSTNRFFEPEKSVSEKLDEILRFIESSFVKFRYAEVVEAEKDRKVSTEAYYVGETISTKFKILLDFLRESAGKGFTPIMDNFTAGYFGHSALFPTAVIIIDMPAEDDSPFAP